MAYEGKNIYYIEKSSGNVKQNKPSQYNVGYVIETYEQLEGIVGQSVGENGNAYSYSSTNLTINGCYNLGEIDGLNDSIKPGGIAGNLDTNATIKNCYISTKGALVPKTGIIVENSYHWYLPTTSYPSSDEDYGYDTDMKTQTFCDKLNSSSTTEPIYKMIKEQEFPALYWQEGTSK